MNLQYGSHPALMQTCQHTCAWVKYSSNICDLHTCMGILGPGRICSGTVMTGTLCCCIGAPACGGGIAPCGGGIDPCGDGQLL